MKNGYFKPVRPIEDIFAFVAISLDGLIRDTILYHHYHLQTGLAIDGGLDGDNLCFTLAIALVALLGGDIMKIMSANL